MRDPDLLNGELGFSKLLFADLDDQVKELLLQVSDLELGLVLLRFLHANGRTHLSADDLAFHIGKSPERVERDLGALVQLGLAEKLHISGVTLFCLTSHPRKQRIVRELTAWQDRWDARLTQVKYTLLGIPPESANASVRLREPTD